VGQQGVVIINNHFGAAFHSLRAVPLDVLKEATHALHAIDPGMPVHIHVAEQASEFILVHQRLSSGRGNQSLE